MEVKAKLVEVNFENEEFNGRVTATFIVPENTVWGAGQYKIIEPITHCEGCDVALFEGDDWMVCDDGPDLCTECQPSSNQKAKP